MDNQSLQIHGKFLWCLVVLNLIVIVVSKPNGGSQVPRVGTTGIGSSIFRHVVFILTVNLDCDVPLMQQQQWLPLIDQGQHNSTYIVWAQSSSNGFHGNHINITVKWQLIRFFPTLGGG